MRRLGFLLAAVVMLLAAGAAGAQSADTLTSFAQRGNLRTGPGVEWATAGTYDPGTPFRADGQAFSGAWVRGIAPDGTVGWVFAEALALPPADAAALRPVYLETPFTLSAPQGGPTAPRPPLAAGAAARCRPPPPPG
jgi:uncharacterized protein YraI